MSAAKKKTKDHEANLEITQVDPLQNLILFFNEIVTWLLKFSTGFILVGGAIFLAIIFGLLFFFNLLGV